MRVSSPLVIFLVFQTFFVCIRVPYLGFIWTYVDLFHIFFGPTKSWSASKVDMPCSHSACESGSSLFWGLTGYACTWSYDNFQWERENSTSDPSCATNPWARVFFREPWLDRSRKVSMEASRTITCLQGMHSNSDLWAMARNDLDGQNLCRSSGKSLWRRHLDWNCFYAVLVDIVWNYLDYPVLFNA